jgi:hypothetical protein
MTGSYAHLHKYPECQVEMFPTVYMENSTAILRNFGCMHFDYSLLQANWLPLDRAILGFILNIMFK